MPEETEAQKFRKAALAELEQIRGIVTKAEAILVELKSLADEAKAAKARRAEDDGD